MTEPQNVETARETLLYIRRTLEAAGQFTAVPGRGLMAAGVVALLGVASNLTLTGAPWEAGRNQAAALDSWGVVLGLALAIVTWGIFRKAQMDATPLRAPLVRKLLWSLTPALFVGGILTHLAVRVNTLELLPAIWLGCYGTAVVNGGQVSVAPVRYMGLTILVAAACAAFAPAALGLFWLGVGFGGVHLVFGAYIASRYHG